MARRLRIEWAPGRKVTARLSPGSEGSPGVLLAHGAGAGQDHPFMVGLRERLAAAGLGVMTFDYPYVAEGRRAPDRPEALLRCHRAAAERLRSYGGRVVLAGKSMGGRMASHVAAEGIECSALVFFGYPLVRPGSAEPRSTDHLGRIGVPMLFLAGSRDRLAPLDVLRSAVGMSPAATLEVFEGADHSFRVPKRMGITDEEMLDRVAETTVEWLGGAQEGEARWRLPVSA